MSPVAMRIHVDASQALRALDKRNFDAARRAALYASVDTMEQFQQQAAVEFIYSQPEGRYKRTGGYLRSLMKGGQYHIRRITSANTVRVGTRIPHAPYLEYGTMYMVARRILETASGRGEAAVAQTFNRVFSSLWPGAGGMGVGVAMIEFEEEE